MTLPSNAQRAARNGGLIPHARTTDKLLTIDRAFLVGIFSIGVFVATNTMIRDDLVKRVDATSLELRDERIVVAQLQIENAVLKTKLEQIGIDVSRIAAWVDRLEAKK